MADKDPKIFLAHILENIALIEKDAGAISKESFMVDDLVRDAVVRRIEIIGEAAKNLPENFKGAHPEILWRQIAGTRDFIAHEYFSIDLDLVWEILRKDLPDLKLKIGEIIKSF